MDIELAKARTNTYKASLDSQKQTYNYITRTYIENIHRVQTFLNLNPRAKETKNPTEDYITHIYKETIS